MSSWNFLHLGDIGDVIYSLPTVRYFDGTLLLGNFYQAWAAEFRERGFEDFGCPLPRVKSGVDGETIDCGLTDKQIDHLIELLNSADTGIQVRRFQPEDTVHFNLMDWRIVKGLYRENSRAKEAEWIDYRYMNLAQAHALSVVKVGDILSLNGILDSQKRDRSVKDSPLIEEFTANYWSAVGGGEYLWNCNWMEMEGSIPLKSNVLIARSGRHDAPSEVWKSLVRAYPDALFVGDPEGKEYRALQDFGFTGVQQPTESLLDLANAIASCSMFIGNQSSPYALAESMKKKSILVASSSTPNCIFKRADGGVVV